MPIALAQLAGHRPLEPEQLNELRDVFLTSEQRARVARMRRIIESCDRLIALAAQRKAESRETSVTVEHFCDFVALARSLAREVEGSVRETADMRLQQEVATRRRPRGRPKTFVGLFGAKEIKERRPAGRPKNVSDEQMKNHLESFIREKEGYKKEVGRKVSDRAFWRIAVQRQPDVKPRDVERLAKRCASDFSKARQQFGMPLRRKGNAKSRNPPKKTTN
jgi:hypothetical protein